MRLSTIALFVLPAWGCASAPPAPPNSPPADAPADEMVLVPGGSYPMGVAREEIGALAELGQAVPHMSRGLARSWFGREMPRHEVRVAPFLLDAREVCNLEYERFVASTGYVAQGDWREHAGPGREQHPVVNVTWHDARAYAEWAGKRLPSEIEWEWAARGGAQHRWFPWGDEDPDFSEANYGHDRGFGDGIVRLLGLQRIKTVPCACYHANGYGLYDMIGNVAEWCEDDLLPYPGASKRVSPWDDEGYLEHPDKVVRGGSWKSPNPVFARVNRRAGRAADEAVFDVGFRCAKSL
jgi:formylglycine-generating enzyme required for sulfatase activity